MSAVQNTAATRTGRRFGRRSLLGSLVAAAVLAGTVSPVAAISAQAASPKTVKIGVVDAQQPYWKIYTKLAKKKYDVTIKLVNFTDYNQPNQALAQGSIDINLFQHIQYLANYNVTNHQTLQPIGSTAVYPLTVYSTKYSKPSKLPKNAKVAIPNDSINEARGLLVLQAAKLLTLKGGGTPFSTIADIKTSKVKVVPVDAAQTAVAVKNGSVAASIVNNNYAVAAKLPKSDKIFADNPRSASSYPYLNVFVTRKADDKKKLYLELAALYQTASITAEVQKESGGSAVFRNVSPKALQTELALVQKQEKSGK